MFDYLKCECPLVVPEALKGDEDFDIEELEFQTYSFPPSCMDEYEITEDGQLYRWQIERHAETNKKNGKLEIKESRKELTKEDYTGEVIFSGLYLGKKFDYFIEYKALFWKGDLKELGLDSVEKESNAARKKSQKKLTKKIKSLESKKGKWWFPFADILRRVIMIVNFLVRWVLGWFVKLTWRIDKWVN